MPARKWPSTTSVIFVVSLLLVAVVLHLPTLLGTASATASSTGTRTNIPLLTPTSTPITLPYCWQSVPAPDAGQNWTHGFMWSVSKVSANDIWALASYVDSQQVSHTSAARWNGSQWGLVPGAALPPGGYSDLVAISDNDVWAVGDNNGIFNAVHWNGSQWSVISPGLASQGASHATLTAVDASGSNDVWAVGYACHGDCDIIYGLVYHWDGLQWQQIRSPSIGAVTEFFSVDVVSPSSVWVGGTAWTQGPYQEVLLYWGGTSLINASPGGGGEIRSIATLSLTDVWASMTNYFNGFVEPRFIHSNGLQWTSYSSQNLQVSQIEPISSTDIWGAAGDTLLHWNGVNWGRVPLPGQNIFGLAAISSNNVWAIGSLSLPNDSRMLVLHYNPSCVPTPRPFVTDTPTLSPIPTNTPTLTPTPIPPRCPDEHFTDVCPGDPFYAYILSLTDDGILSGYNTSPPCPNTMWIPCFNPNNTASRGQITKVVSLAANFTEPVSGWQFQDVPPGSTFYTYTNRLASRGIVSGYPCGGIGEPCVPPDNLPYFRTNREVTRGQLSKMVANAFNWTDPVTNQSFEDIPPGSTFYTYTEQLASRGIIAGYHCGGQGEPCIPPENRPYFRPNANVTRGQTAKIVQLARTQPTPTPTPSPTTTQATETAIPTFTETPTPDLTTTPTSTTLTLR